MKREPLLAALLCLLGAFVVLVGAGRSWSDVALTAGALAPARTVGVAGTDVVPGLQALGLVGLAGVVALAATRRWGRLVVGLLLLLTGLGVVASVLGADVTGAALRDEAVTGAGGDVRAARTTAWPAVTATGGVLLAVAGSLVVARGRRWSSLGRRYDAPAARAVAEPAGERELWDALDRGEDPTGGRAPVDDPPPADPAQEARPSRG